MRYDQSEEDIDLPPSKITIIQKLLIGLFCMLGAMYVVSAAINKSDQFRELIRWSEILNLPLRTIHQLIEASLLGLFVVGAAYGWYRKTVNDTNYRNRQVRCYRKLLGSILLALADYTIKTIQFSKNLFYYPIGVDSRVFNKTYKKIEYSTLGSSSFAHADWELKTINNAYCSPLKIWSGTLCLLTYMISLWVAHSVAKTFFPFISDIQSLKFYTISLAFSVLLCDIAIIRISTQLHVQKLRGKPVSKTVSALVIAFRSIIVVSTATLLAFSFSIPFLESTLTERLREQEKQRIFSQKSNIDLAAERADLATRLFHLQAKQFCTAYAFSGIKGNPFYSKDNWQRALAQIPLANTTSDDALKVNPSKDVSCSAYLRTDEPACISVTVGATCPNASRLAREVFLEARELLGESEARANYDSGGVARTVGRWEAAATPLLLQYKLKLERLNRQLDDVSSLRVTISLDAYCEAKEELKDLSIEKIWSYAKSIFIPAPFQCKPVTTASVAMPKLDLNSAANTFFSQLSQIFSTAKGMLFVATVVAILAMFELLVIIYKSFGQFPTVEGLKFQLLLQFDDYLYGIRTLDQCPMVLSEMEFSTDWSIVDHLFHITSDLIALCKSYMTTPLSSLLMLSVPGALLVFIVLKVAA